MPLEVFDLYTNLLNTVVKHFKLSTNAHLYPFSDRKPVLKTYANSAYPVQKPSIIYAYRNIYAKYNT